MSKDKILAMIETALEISRAEFPEPYYKLVLLDALMLIYAQNLESDL